MMAVAVMMAAMVGRLDDGAYSVWAAGDAVSDAEFQHSGV